MRLDHLLSRELQDWSACLETERRNPAAPFPSSRFLTSTELDVALVRRPMRSPSGGPAGEDIGACMLLSFERPTAGVPGRRPLAGP